MPAYDRAALRHELLGRKADFTSWNTAMTELETAYKAMFGHYTDNIYAIVFIQDTLVTAGGKANYLVSLDEATDSTFKATAVSVIDFDGDGQFSQWQVDETGNIIEIVED